MCRTGSPRPGQPRDQPTGQHIAHLTSRPAMTDAERTPLSAGCAPPVCPGRAVPGHRSWPGSASGCGRRVPRSQLHPDRCVVSGTGTTDHGFGPYRRPRSSSLAEHHWPNTIAAVHLPAAHLTHEASAAGAGGPKSPAPLPIRPHRSRAFPVHRRRACGNPSPPWSFPAHRTVACGSVARSRSSASNSCITTVPLASWVSA